MSEIYIALLNQIYYMDKKKDYSMLDFTAGEVAMAYTLKAINRAEWSALMCRLQRMKGE